MKTLLIMTIIKILDSIISLSLLIIGLYIFFIKQDFVSGAIIIGVHSLYQIPTLLTLKNKII